MKLIVPFLLLGFGFAADGGESTLTNDDTLLTIDDVKDLDNDIYIPSYNDELIGGADVGIDNHDHKIFTHDHHGAKG